MEINKNKILAQLETVIEKCAEELNLVVLEASFKKESGTHVLRIFIYNSIDPITHQECSDFTKLLSSMIDDTDIITVPYSLEVSSPGLNKKLKNPIEFLVFKGKQVKAILKKPIDPEEKYNVYTGELLGLSEETNEISIKLDNAKEVSIDLKNIKSINLEG